MHSETATYHILYPLRYRRAGRGKALAHLVPAILLVSGLLPLLLGQEPLTALLLLEVLIGGCYLALMARELRHLRHPTPHHERVAWLELAAAGILGLEGYHIWHRHHEHNVAAGTHTFHVLPWLYMGAALVFVVLAFGMRQLLERRFLHLHADGFAGRLQLLGAPFSYRWADVRTVEPADPARALVWASDDQPARQLSFGHLLDGPAWRDQLVAHAHAHLPGS